MHILDSYEYQDILRDVNIYAVKVKDITPDEFYNMIHNKVISSNLNHGCTRVLLNSIAKHVEKKKDKPDIIIIYKKHYNFLDFNMLKKEVADKNVELLEVVKDEV